MSIVIALIDRLSNSLYFYGDKRQSRYNLSGQHTYSDDFTKVFKLKEDLFLGVTGNADLAMQLVEKTEQILHLSNDNIINEINEINNVPVSEHIKLFATIAGRII